MCVILAEAADYRVCPECGNNKMINDNSRGEIICENCGLVIEDRIIDPGPEYRLFNDDQKNTKMRTGGPAALTLFDKGLATGIDNLNKDYAGKKLTPQQSKCAYRVRKWNKRSRVNNGIERNLCNALSELELACSTLQVSKDIKNEAASIYRRALKRQKLSGRRIRNMVIASLYIACRLKDSPNSIKDFTKLLGIRRRELNRYTSLLREILEIKIPIADPNDFVAKYCSELGLSFKVQKKVYEMVEKLKTTNIWSGRNPIKFISAVIYLAAILEKERRTQSQISNATKVSEVTIRNRSKDIIKVLKINVN